HWVSTENANERLGVPPELVTDYLALVGDSSDNIPGVRGIGDKTAAELVSAYGNIENILAAAPQITKKRPREALLSQSAEARLSKQLVTIHDDVPISLDVDSLKVRDPDKLKLRNLYVELEFHALARQIVLDEPTPAERAVSPTRADAPRQNRYATATSVEDVSGIVARARAAKRIAVALETAPEQGAPSATDPLRAEVVGIGIAVAPGEAWYIPIGHRAYQQSQTILELTSEEPAPKKTKSKAKTAEPVSIAARALAQGIEEPVNVPPLTDPAMRPLRELLEDATVGKAAQNGKFDTLVLRRLGIDLRGLEFDTMIASYVLDPGRRAHALDVLALEFFEQRITSLEDLCGKGRALVPYDQVPVR